MIMISLTNTGLKCPAVIKFWQLLSLLLSLFIQSVTLAVENVPFECYSHDIAQTYTIEPGAFSFSTDHYYCSRSLAANNRPESTSPALQWLIRLWYGHPEKQQATGHLEEAWSWTTPEALLSVIQKHRQSAGVSRPPSNTVEAYALITQSGWELIITDPASYRIYQRHLTEFFEPVDQWLNEHTPIGNSPLWIVLHLPIPGQEASLPDADSKRITLKKNQPKIKTIHLSRNKQGMLASARHRNTQEKLAEKQRNSDTGSELQKERERAFELKQSLSLIDDKVMKIADGTYVDKISGIHSLPTGKTGKTGKKAGTQTQSQQYTSHHRSTTTSHCTDDAQSQEEQETLPYPVPYVPRPCYPIQHPSAHYSYTKPKSDLRNSGVASDSETKTRPTSGWGFQLLTAGQNLSPIVPPDPPLLPPSEWSHERFLSQCTDDVEEPMVVHNTCPQDQESGPGIPLTLHSDNPSDLDSPANEAALSIGDAVDTQTLEPNLCQICYGNQVNAILLPCGHAKTCLSCAQKIKDSPQPVCPYCRKPISLVCKIIL